MTGESTYDTTGGNPPDTTKSNVNYGNYLNQEKIRYKSKGYGLIFGFLTTISYFYFAPTFINNLYLQIIPAKDKLEPGKFSFWLIVLLHEIVFIFANIPYLIIYKLKINFFERYKVNDKRWPWDENPEKWSKTLQENIKLILINHLLIVPFSLCIHYFKNVSPYLLDVDKLPTHFDVL